MTTLIAVYSGDGTCLGRCDARCYNAAHANCQCICGGRNHAAGKDQAMDNTREMYAPWLDEYEKEHPFAEVEVPALYTCKTRTATKIARIINARENANVVRDVRRLTKAWEVDVADGNDVTTVYYPNLQAVRDQQGIVQMKLFNEPA